MARFFRAKARDVEIERANERLREEIAERHRVERRLRAKDAVAQALAESDDLASAAPRLLQAVCENLHWQFGALWIPSDDGSHLRFVASWHDAGDARAAPFSEACRRRVFSFGEGLPGKIWREGALWVVDMAREVFPRAPEAAEAGLHGAFGFPILLHGRVLGVVEFFARENLQPDPDLLKMAGVLGSQLGQFVERARAQEDLRKSEARMRTIVHAALDAVVAVDEDDRIVEWNPQAERLFGWSRDDAVGRTLQETLLRPVPGADRLRSLLPFARQSGLASRFEEPVTTRDGGTVPVEVSVSSGSHGGRTVHIAYLRDVRDRKALEAMRERSKALEAEKLRFEEASRLKSQFLANVSHELRTPMNAIIGFAQLMHDGRVGPVSSAHREYLADILASAQHLLQIINDVLDLSKVESGRLDVRSERVALPAAIAEVRDVLRGLADKKRIFLSIDVDPAVAEVTTDRAKLNQVLYNYLSNALKFTAEGGRVGVRAFPDGDGAFRIEVRDSGIGIRPQDRARLFLEFQQLDQGAAKRYPGTGLGLALTRRIVEAQGGSVGVESEPGRGSTFFAVLPRAPLSSNGAR